MLEDYLRAMTYFGIILECNFNNEDFGGHCPGEPMVASVVVGCCYVEMKYYRSFTVYVTQFMRMSQLS